MLLWVFISALVLDQWFGEPRRFHPLIGFGRIAALLEHRCNRGGHRRRLRGAAMWLLLVLPPVLLIAFLSSLPYLYLPLSIVCLYAAIGRKSLRDHCLIVLECLQRGDLVAARENVAMIVSRDCETLDERGVSRAAVESALENGSDAIFSALFWLAVGGPAAVVGYRLANTLDAMWGYRNERFEQFGWASARLDDILNYVPARLTALSYALAGSCLAGLHCWWQQAHRCASPNGGPVMCSGAGALGITLGGGAHYAGLWRNGVTMGEGRSVNPQDIGSALTLLDRSLAIWLLVVGGVSVLQMLLHG